MLRFIDKIFIYEGRCGVGVGLTSLGLQRHARNVVAALARGIGLEVRCACGRHDKKHRAAIQRRCRVGKSRHK